MVAAIKAPTPRTWPAPITELPERNLAETYMEGLSKRRAEERAMKQLEIQEQSAQVRLRTAEMNHEIQSKKLENLARTRQEEEDLKQKQQEFLSTLGEYDWSDRDSVMLAYAKAAPLKLTDAVKDLETLSGRGMNSQHLQQTLSMLGSIGKKDPDRFAAAQKELVTALQGDNMGGFATVVAALTPESAADAFGAYEAPTRQEDNSLAGIRFALDGNEAGALTVAPNFMGQQVKAYVKVDDEHVKVTFKNGSSVVVSEDDYITTQANATTLAQAKAYPQQDKNAKAADTEEVFSRLQSLKKQIQQLPQAVGLYGSAAGSPLVGVLRQIPGVSSTVESAFPKESVDEIRKIRNEAQILFGQLMPKIINEDSGRYSEGDVARAKEAYKILNASSDFNDVMGAIANLENILASPSGGQAATETETTDDRPEAIEGQVYINDTTGELMRFENGQFVPVNKTATSTSSTPTPSPSQTAPQPNRRGRNRR